MRSSSFAVLAVLFGGFLAVAPLPAHQSFSAEYDAKKLVEMKGIVSKVEWMNPHVYFSLDVKDDSGNITNWSFEMGPPNGLERSGWTRNTMKVGDEVIVEGTLAKDGSKQANARSVTMANTGKKLGAASSQLQQDQQKTRSPARRARSATEAGIDVDGGRGCRHGLRTTGAVLWAESSWTERQG